MAQEGSEASVASTSTNPNWWDIHANPISLWNSWQQQRQQQLANPNSSSCDEDISISGTSFTNTSNQSGLSVGSTSATDLSGEPAATENHLWRQVLLSTGNGGDLHKNHGDGGNFLEALSSKNFTTDMFGPAACDYLKKLDESWEFTTPTSFSNLEKQLHSCDNKIVNHERPANFSDLVSNWSIAPPQPQFDHRSASAGLFEPNFSQIKHEVALSSSYSSSGYGMSSSSSGNVGFLRGTYGHAMKGESRLQEFGANSQPSFLRPISLNNDGIAYQVGPRNSISGIGSKYYVSDAPWSNTRNFSDLINFGGSVNCRIPKPCSVKGSDSPDSKKPGHDISSAARGNVKVGIGNTSEGKKKRSEDTSEGLLKKSKHEISYSTSAKFQAPKVKLGEKITALQQIVSPFGKTDTASVLLEAINYIRFLHEEVQLLSDPFIKSGVNKDLNSWGGLERKDKQEIKLDLSSRGLCLVPISCTPQIYRENTGPDYWTPTYRGCLYR